MNNHFPRMPRQDTTEIFVLPSGDLYALRWRERTPIKLVMLLRQVVTDCGGEYLGVL